MRPVFSGLQVVANLVSAGAAGASADIPSTIDDCDHKVLARARKLKCWDVGGFTRADKGRCKNASRKGAVGIAMNWIPQLTQPPLGPHLF